MCFTHFIRLFGFTKHLKLSLLQYGTIHVLWDTDSFATVKRRGSLASQPIVVTRDSRNLLSVYT